MKQRNIKRILGSGFLIALPLGIIGYILFRMISGMEIVIRPMAEALHIQKLLGELTLTILSVFVLLLFIILLGLLMQLPVVAIFSRHLESIAFRIFPSLQQLKTLTADKLDFGEHTGQWRPVLLYYEEKYSPAYVVEEDERLISLFVMKGASLSEGELLITEKSAVKMESISAAQLHQFSRQYGRGFLALLREKEYMRDEEIGANERDPA